LAGRTTRWIELSVEAHPEAVDAIANVFQEAGTGGVAIEQPLHSDVEGELAPEPTGPPRIRAYLPLDDIEPEVERRIERDLWHLQAFNLAPIGPLSRREIDEEDWASAWKEHFLPLRVGRIVVKPSWRDWEPEPDQIVVELDPGMAFGTGLHPTTRLMLAALQTRVHPGMRVLDLGTGSGILAIAAALLGATVHALDVDRVAVKVAANNVHANGLSNQITLDEGSIEKVAGERFDLMLANIIASVLADLAGPLAAALEDGAELLASGIVEERAGLVRAAFEDAGMTIATEQRDEDWLLMVARSAP
jgi:ribosomal protein L11 methyltransferase